MGKLDIEIIQSETIIKFKHIIYKNIFIVTMVITYILVASKWLMQSVERLDLKMAIQTGLVWKALFFTQDQVTLVIGLK